MIISVICLLNDRNTDESLEDDEDQNDNPLQNSEEYSKTTLALIDRIKTM